MVKPMKSSRKTVSVEMIITLMIAVILLFGLSFLYFKYVILINASDYEASYWGAVIGGIASGVLAFLGVFYTIKYYKDADIEKELQKVRPYIFVEECIENNAYLPIYYLGDYKYGDKKATLDIAISNIGLGVARVRNVTNLNKEDGAYINWTLKPNGNRLLTVLMEEDAMDKGVTFSIEYEDIMSNKYTQSFKICYNYTHDAFSIEDENYIIN